MLTGRRQCANPTCRRFLHNGKPGRRGAKPQRLYCSRKCTGKAYGLRVRGSGSKHIMIRLPDGTRQYLHILVAEQKLGRKLLPEEIVHHEDEDKFNNDPSNIKVTKDRADHLREHGYYRDSDHRRRKRNAEPVEEEWDDEIPF